MTIEKAIEVLETEIECVSRINCDHDCEYCELSMDLKTILNAYKMAINGLYYKNKWDGLYTTITGMIENNKPFEDERDWGYDDACTEILKVMWYMTGNEKSEQK